MDSNEVALIISAVAASLASIIYSFKHVRKSQCCGNTCEQVIVDAPTTPKHKRDSVVTLAPVPVREASPVPPVHPDLSQPSVWEWLARPRPVRTDTEV